MYGGGTQAKDHKISTDPDPRPKLRAQQKCRTVRTLSAATLVEKVGQTIKRTRDG